ncbi:MAG: MoxR family ATPase, partial [Acetivibrionales bacterium]
QQEIRNVHVDKSLSNYIVEIVSQTRKHPDVALGSSPRGSLALFRASQAWAFYNGRDFVIPDDIRKMVIPVLSHRIMLKQDAKLKKINPVEILNYIVSRINVPVVS